MSGHAKLLSTFSVIPHNAPGIVRKKRPLRNRNRDVVKSTYRILVILIVALLGGAAIYLYWGSVSPSPFWDYLRANDSPASAIGGLGAAIGALVTAVVMFFTARAAGTAAESTRIASRALELSERNNNITEFNQRFSLLLAQHNSYLEKVIHYLNNNGKEAFSEIWTSTQHLASFNKLKGHLVISTYMRILYHLLRFIKEDHYDKNASPRDRRKYSSLVRSVIPNNVLFLIALNASITQEDGKDNNYGYYQFLLHYFDFFEHALFFSAAKSEFVITEEHVTQAAKTDKLVTQFFNLMHDFITTQKAPDDTALTLELPLVLSWIYANHLHKETRATLTSLEERFRERYDFVRNLLIVRENYDEDKIALLGTCFCYLPQEQKQHAEAMLKAKKEGQPVTREMIESYLHGEDVFPEKEGFERVFINARNENIYRHFWHLRQYRNRFVLYQRGDTAALLMRCISECRAQLDEIDRQLVHEDPTVNATGAVQP
ncbi:hypothetical protein GWD52_16480 [Enterobacteriaceae bacterium 4M9]|nr:hypothetical protein [Enterobacteriaceae bacterium 4M9]